MRHIQGEQIDWFSQSLSDFDFSINIGSQGKTFQIFRGSRADGHNKFLETNKIFICVFEKGL